jgi:beta-phosphoglucomutase-like phosphatase (HAD superfamily)
MFHAIVAGDDVPRKKPAPDVYLRAREILGLPAKSCLAIEDSRNGLLSATRAGMAVLVVKSAYFRDENFREASLVIDEFDDLSHSAGE